MPVDIGDKADMGDIVLSAANTSLGPMADPGFGVTSPLLLLVVDLVENIPNLKTNLPTTFDPANISRIISSMFARSSGLKALQFTEFLSTY